MNRYKYMVDDLEFLTGHSNISQLIYSINASLKFKYIYFETPKAACSTLKRFLIKNEYEDIALFDDDRASYAEFNVLHAREYSPLLNVRQLYPFRKCLEGGGFFKFCFVRDPYARLLSAYLEKILNNRAQAGQIRSVLGHTVNSDVRIDFGAFVEAVCAIPVAMMDPHWKVQYYHVCMDRISYDLVGKVENFDEDLDKLCGAVGLDKQHLRFFSPHRTDAAGLLNDYYTPRLRQLVRDKYEMDFRAFGYD